MRAGAEYFTQPSEPPQRRYEALRAYLVEGVSAQEAGSRYGYSAASVYQMVRELRAGRVEFFRSSKPGPKGPRKAGAVRTRVLELRARDRSVTEIARSLTAEGTPVSHQTVFEILRSEGLERLPRRGRAERGAPPRTAPVKARALRSWPEPAALACDHAGLGDPRPGPRAAEGGPVRVGPSGFEPESRGPEPPRIDQTTPRTLAGVDEGPP